MGKFEKQEFVWIQNVVQMVVAVSETREIYIYSIHIYKNDLEHIRYIAMI